MRWGLYNKRTHKTVSLTDEVFDPTTVALYDPETHRLIEKFAWDPDNFESREELETFLTEFLGFEPEPEGIAKKPMTFDWEKDVPEEIVVVDRQVKQSSISAADILSPTITT